MRRIYSYMASKEKQEALSYLTSEIEELEKEVKKDRYPRVVQDALHDTIMRYKAEEEFLKKETKENR